jgi:hypothetical protein
MKRNLPRKRKLESVMFPYCIKREPGSAGHVLLNQDYKPIGFNTSERIDYNKHPIVHRIRITPKTAAALSWKSDNNTEEIFMYCKPLRAHDVTQYFERLAHLSKMLAKTDIVEDK